MLTTDLSTETTIAETKKKIKIMKNVCHASSES